MTITCRIYEMEFDENDLLVDIEILAETFDTEQDALDYADSNGYLTDPAYNIVLEDEEGETRDVTHWYLDEMDAIESYSFNGIDVDEQLA